MEVERTIEFLLKNQARMDARMNARFAKADLRMDRLERVVAQNNRVVTRLTRYGVSLQSDVRRIDKNLGQATQNLSKVSERLSETDGKLNALIDIANQHIRGKGRQR
jgi:septal ring factor EnvC (AmiA/AmiB activator)